MGLSCGENDCDKKESEVPMTDESRESRERGGDDTEFWPVEHPMEPQDEDRPVKCPMPASSVINDGRMREETYAESLRKRGELPAVVNKEGIVVVAAERPVQAVRKRHHTLTHGNRLITPSTRMPPPSPPPPPLPSQNITIFQMLQQFDKFEY